MASIISELFGKVLPEKPNLNDMWDALTVNREATDETAVNILMDKIISDTGFRELYKGLMISESGATVQRNRVHNPGSVYSPSNALALVDVSLIASDAAVSLIDGSASLMEEALALPNLGGVPISPISLTSSREIDVGEQVMIVQSTTQKQYWTDNAVPKLKEWNIEGYIRTSLSLDAHFVIKPSLKMQINFLDTCAKSRKPVLFKDNRGEFIFVQIMNLQTTEEASYNNAIKVNISLKEYKPFTINNNASLVEIASTMDTVNRLEDISNLNEWGI